jgi:hypothetical protein
VKLKREERTLGTLHPKIVDVRFQPWKGSKFEESSSRLLIVGQSHYDWEERDIKDCCVTTEVIRDEIKGICRRNFFTNIAATCIGHAGRFPV